MSTAFFVTMDTDIFYANELPLNSYKLLLFLGSESALLPPIKTTLCNFLKVSQARKLNLQSFAL